MAHSIAVLRTMGIQLADVARFAAGHSLGEYSALCAAGSFDLATTAKLLKLRGQAMQQAVPVGQGAMAALLGADLTLAQKIAAAAAQGEVCTVANDNDPSQVVLSGHKGAIERAIEMAKEMGAKRAVPLPVSAPFHCPLMQPAADAMAEALGKTVIEPPHVPLFANVTAEAVADPARIEQLLVEQVTGMVRWRESIANMLAAGVDEYVELGGKVLGPMVKRIAPDAKVTSAVMPERSNIYAISLMSASTSSIVTMLVTCASGTMRLTIEPSTLPPISTNSCAPASNMLETLSRQRTMPVT
jgi:[acyl-carrier-protein] S-malonyltransferase